ncbi:MAG: hypothetical protein ACE5GC_06860, partial [Acidimicrobiia bacterium]
MRHRRALAVVLAAVMGAAACGPATEQPAETTTSSPTSAAERTLPPPRPGVSEDRRRALEPLAAAWNATRGGDEAAVARVVHPESIHLYGANRCAEAIAAAPELATDRGATVMRFTPGPFAIDLDGLRVIAQAPATLQIGAVGGAVVEVLEVEDRFLLDCGEPLPGVLPMVVADL